MALFWDRTSLPGKLLEWTRHWLERRSALWSAPVEDKKLGAGLGVHFGFYLVLAVLGFGVY